MKTLPFVLAFLGVILLVRADHVSWTGAIDGSWDNAGNWDPSMVPGENDTALIGVVATPNKNLQLAGESYSLAELSFQDGGFHLSGNSDTTLTLLGGVLYSEASDDSENVITADLILGAAANSISVFGDVHRLALNNLLSNGPLTTHVDGEDGCLELNGTTTVQGTLVKTGDGQVCIMSGFDLTATSIQGGFISVEADGSLGDVTIAAGSALLIDMGATAAAGKVESAGTLIISEFVSGNGTLQASEGVTIQNGGTLSGAGTIQGDVTIMEGATVEGGAYFESAGLSITGNLTMSGTMGVTIVNEHFDLIGSINLTGDLNLSGLLYVQIVDVENVEGLYGVITYTGELTGAFSGVVGTNPGYHYQLIYNHDEKMVQLQVTAVPEPSTAALLATAGLLLIRRRKGRDHSASPRRRGGLRSVSKPFSIRTY